MALDYPHHDRSTVAFTDNSTQQQNSGPYLVSSRQCGAELEDDSLDVVFSADTGAGRAHTPQRLNRSNTPQRPRSSSLLNIAPAPVHISTASNRGGGGARRQPLGRRKQRRWDNDNLIGVEKLLRGRHASEEGEAKHLTVSVSRRSSLSDLVSDENRSAHLAEVRERVRKGAQPAAVAADAAGCCTRRFAGGKWEDAEERFLLVERRLRDIVVRGLRNSTVLSFVVGLEILLETFARDHKALTPVDLPAALATALAAHPTVELELVASGSSKERLAPTLSVPLGPSPFHRLLLHALCQYRRLRSKSEETASGRTVRVTIPPPRRSKESGGNDKYKQDAVLPSATLTDFVLETRLAIQPHVAVAAVSAVPATSSSGPARPAAAVAPMAGDSQWGGLKEHQPTSSGAITILS